MSKKTVYTLFVLKFLFSLALIFWTIKMTMSAGVGEDNDNTFLSTYANVDDNFNEFYNNNVIFNKKYNTFIKINNEQLNSMTFEDIFLSQRVIKQRDIRKNILNSNGKNSIAIVIKNKVTNEIIKDINASIIFTRPSGHDDDFKININQSNSSTDFNISKKAYWNIMGAVKIGNDEGHFYIKSNSK